MESMIENEDLLFMVLMNVNIMSKQLYVFVYLNNRKKDIFGVIFFWLIFVFDLLLDFFERFLGKFFGVWNVWFWELV